MFFAQLWRETNQMSFAKYDTLTGLKTIVIIKKICHAVLSFSLPDEKIKNKPDG